MVTWNRYIFAAIAALVLLGACSEDRGVTQEQPAPTPAGMTTDSDHDDLDVAPTDTSPD